MSVIRTVLLAVVVLACGLQVAVATEAFSSEEAAFEASFEAELGAAQEMSVAALFQVEAEMHLQFDPIELLAPQDVTDAVKDSVFKFCKSPAAEKPQALKGWKAYVNSEVKDAALDCVAALAEAFDKGPLDLASIAATSCLSSLSSAEVLLRIKVQAENPLNPFAAKYQKLVEFFEEHPLVQFAFTEALSVAVDLATSGGDFVKVATNHAQAWAIEIGKNVITPAWNTLHAGLTELQKRWSMTSTADILRSARQKIYDFIYANSPPSVRAAIGTLADASAASTTAHAIQKELYDSAPGKAYLAARAKFVTSSINVMVNVGQGAAGIAGVVAGAPTGVASWMAALTTYVALRKIKFSTMDAAKEFCETVRAWRSCLDSVAGKRYLEAKAYASTKWAEARRAALNVLTLQGPLPPTASAAAAAPAPLPLTDAQIRQRIAEGNQRRAAANAGGLMSYLG